MPSMTEVSQGATPTLELTLPPSIDLSGMNIYFSIEQFNRTIIEKSNADGGEDVTFSENTVSVYLSQLDTLQLEEGDATVQINLVGGHGKTRVPTYEAPIKIIGNQIKRVLA